MNFDSYERVVLQKVFVVLLLSSLFAACAQQKSDSANYRNEIKAWQAERTRSLLAEDGWLNLVGLFELHPGINTFGSGADNDLVFNVPAVPAHIGYFDVDEQISIKIVAGVLVVSASDTVREMPVMTDADSAATIFALGSLRWHVIQRGEKRYVRLRDFESEAVKRFAGNKYYPIDPKWRVQAELKPFDKHKIVPVPNVLGEIIEWNSPGQLELEIDGETYQLTALGDMGDDELFVIFSDATNGSETYPAGRFMYVRTPGEDGLTVLDFNKAYNPPCVYTEYATCPLPPAENNLQIRVEAGEKNYGGSHELNVTY